MLNNALHNLATLFVLALLLPATSALAQQLPPELQDVDVTEHLGDNVPMDLEFVDHNGNDVRMADYFEDDLPVIITLNYYTCPMLCSLQLNGLIAGLQELGWEPGENFRIVTVSIDPEEDHTLAAAKRRTYLEELGMGEDVDWDFLTTDEETITTLSETLGFGYRYVREIDEYAHPAVLFMISPDGVITRYLYGIQYPPFDLRMAILEAGRGQVGTTVDRVILSCFQYDPERNSYTVFAFGVVRIGGILTVLILGIFLGFLWVRDIRRRLAKD